MISSVGRKGKLVSDKQLAHDTPTLSSIAVHTFQASLDNIIRGAEISETAQPPQVKQDFKRLHKLVLLQNAAIKEMGNLVVSAEKFILDNEKPREQEKGSAPMHGKVVENSEGPNSDAANC